MIRSQAELASMPSILRPTDVSDKIFKYRPQATKTLTILGSRPIKTVKDYEFTMAVQACDPSYVTVTGAPGSAGVANTQLKVSTTDAKYIRAGENLLSAWNEPMLVTAVDDATGIITVATDISGNGIVATDKISRGSAGSEEMSSRPTAMTRQPDTLTNYVETLRDVTGESEHVNTTMFQGGARLFNDLDDMRFEHKRSINRGLLVNLGAKTTQNGKTLYKTSGLRGLVSSNTHDFSASKLSYAAMRQALTTDTRFCQGGELLFIAGAKVMELIDLMLRKEVGPTQYVEFAQGMFKLPWLGVAGKKIYFVEEDSLDGALVNVGFLAEADALEIVTTEDQKSKTKQWMQETTITPEMNANGTDGTLVELKSRYGLRINGEQRCALWYGINDIA